jgi:hypothetical protein
MNNCGHYSCPLVLFGLSELWGTAGGTTTVSLVGINWFPERYTEKEECELCLQGPRKALSFGTHFGED